MRKTEIFHRIYGSGIIFNFSTLLLGNIYYGSDLSHKYGNYNLHDGVVYGISKSIFYSPLSWGFQSYAIYKHLFGKESSRHYKYHLIPNSLQKSRQVTYKEYFDAIKR